MKDVRPDLCFVCERTFAPLEPPAETWAAGAQGEHVILVCRDCVHNPPGGLPRSLETLPSELRQPLIMHLWSLSMRHRIKLAPRSERAPTPNHKPPLARTPGLKRQPLRRRPRG